ncbi:MAG TPA: CHASE2 domain-containing protein [Novosphingobium sp.]|nr:CHASE2 domain-containing protein [Novosphingobium sp.]
MRWAARPAWHAILQAALLILVGLLNPFEIVQWSELRSHDLWERLHAHDYPSRRVAAAGSGARARDQVTVLYFDDGSVARQGQTRPLSPFVLDELLTDLEQWGGPPPRAIFVDMLLTDAAPAGATAADMVGALTEPAVVEGCRTRRDATLPPFQCLLADVARMTRYEAWRSEAGCLANTAARIACIEQARGIPVMFGDPRLGEGVASGALPSAALDALGEVALTVPIGVRVHEYPLVEPLGPDPSDRRMYMLSPGAALYAAWCGVSHEKAAAGPARRCAVPPVDELNAGAASPATRQYRWSDRFADPIDIEWGIGPKREKGIDDPERLLVASGPCHGPRPGLGPSLARLVRLSFAGINGPQDPFCMYARAFPVDVMQWAAFTADDAQALIADRLVVVGGRFSDSNDVLDTPVFLGVPGVHFHAMALDNLIERGPGYARPLVPLTSALDLTASDLFNFAVFFVIALILALTTKALRPAERGGLVRAGGSRAILAHLAIFAGGVVAMGAFAWFFVGLDSVIWPDGALVPASFNLVGALLIAFVGLAELAWAALLPVREWLATRFSARRIFHALRLLAGGHDIEAVATTGPGQGPGRSDTSEEEKA